MNEPTPDWKTITPLLDRPYIDLHGIRRTGGLAAMICPKCGSRDIDDHRSPETRQIHAHCNRCGHHWHHRYDTSTKAGDHQP